MSVVQRAVSAKDHFNANRTSYKRPKSLELHIWCYNSEENGKPGFQQTLKIGDNEVFARIPKYRKHFRPVILAYPSGVLPSFE